MAVNFSECFYSLDSMVLKLSFELFPPKRGHKLKRVLKDIIADFGLGFFKFSSLTCGAGGGSSGKHNSIKIVIYLLQYLVSLSLLVHMLYADRSGPALAMLVASFLQTGMFSFLFLKGDRYNLLQIRSDSASFADLDNFKRMPVVFGSTCYPDAHPRCAGLRGSLASFAAKCGLGCASFFSQFYNDASTFGRSCLRRATVASASFVSGFFSSSRARLACRMANKCGIYLSCCLKKIMRVVNKRWLIASSVRVLNLGLIYSMGKLHFFVLNRIRVLKQMNWLADCC